ncbi:gem-associated protein 7 [Rhea pennata]|uniref:gem-associated protein 7 n=1 Tax=Rhea pennata TaxID=8795 RepID=UPI002E260155
MPHACRGRPARAEAPSEAGGDAAVPVGVIRLPRGPEGSSRGFDPASPRFRAPGAGGAPEQRQRAALRERYLRSLFAMAGRRVRFALYERVSVAAVFGASDIDVLNFQVSELQTPLGVQKEALLRCSDIIAYTFHLD